MRRIRPAVDGREICRTTVSSLLEVAIKRSDLQRIQHCDADEDDEKSECREAKRYRKQHRNLVTDDETSSPSDDEGCKYEEKTHEGELDEGRLAHWWWMLSLSPDRERCPLASSVRDSIDSDNAKASLSADMLEVGSQAPTFQLPNQSGDRISLDDFAGKHVVVYFYPRADTAGCTTEACEFRDAWSEFEAANVAVVGISDDPVDDLDSFAAKYELPFDLLSDEDGTVASMYDSYGEKKMFGRTFDGVFRNTYLVGPDGTIEAVFKKVSPEGHAGEILDAIR